MFDLGARTFEGIRNASRMEPSPEEGVDAVDADSSDRYTATSEAQLSPPPRQGALAASESETSSISGASSRVESIPKSPVPPASRQASLSMSGSGNGGGEGSGVVGGLALLSLRARPPRQFGPRGEMDPFTWEASLAQAILRAVVRDDGDVPSERCGCDLIVGVRRGDR